MKSTALLRFLCLDVSKAVAEWVIYHYSYVSLEENKYVQGYDIKENAKNRTYDKKSGNGWLKADNRRCGILRS